MNTEELADRLLAKYGIASRTKGKHRKTTRISSRTLRNWAAQGLISRTWRHDGKKGRPRSEFPKRAIAEAATLWAIKKTKLIRGYPPTKEEFKQIKGVEYGYKPRCLVSDVTGDQWHPTSLAGGQLRVDGMSSARILIF